MNDKMLELLYRSLDGVLTPDEQASLNEALAASEELRAEKRRLHAMRQAVAQSAADTFRPFFAARVMQRIARSAEPKQASESFFRGLVYTFRRVALAGAMIIAAFIIYNITASDEISFTTVLGAPEISIEEVFEPPLNSILEDLS
jgi:anti-sigma factor RsiW